MRNMSRDVGEWGCVELAERRERISLMWLVV